ncbi:hypothetical protein BRADI_1g46445v3 [Brachypodium distachyon]|uniref:Uncharacterized protein n=1 Tax=Brachypodium distachyon TaxID=15368 RepID=A0A2K2DPQ7_BRADI|nr:hypothetical protein BRADI_1g46445v3 [Brachypodium distachyon]
MNGGRYAGVVLVVAAAMPSRWQPLKRSCPRKQTHPHIPIHHSCVTSPSPLSLSPCSAHLVEKEDRHVERVRQVKKAAQFANLRLRPGICFPGPVVNSNNVVVVHVCFRLESTEYFSAVLSKMRGSTYVLRCGGRTYARLGGAGPGLSWCALCRTSKQAQRDPGRRPGGRGSAKRRRWMCPCPRDVHTGVRQRCSISRGTGIFDLRFVERPDNNLAHLILPDVMTDGRVPLLFGSAKKKHIAPEPSCSR